MLEPKHSLAWYKRHPLFAAHPRHTPLASCASHIKADKDGLGTVNPDTEAVHFYYLNHLWAHICQSFDDKEVLPAEYRPLVEKYLDMATKQAARLFSYTMLVITRESRHLHKSDSFRQALKAQWGEGYLYYLDSIGGTGSGTAANSLVNNPPNMDLVDYVSAVEMVFFKGKFSGGYGGHPWGHIAANIGRLVRGEISYEMMVDTAYTLAHNNGPMFNKGMLYDMYSKEFIKILDVQRSGQMPQYVREHGLFADLQHLEDKLKIGVHKEATQYVDWEKVEKLGSVKKYTTEKMNQFKKYGPSPYNGSTAADTLLGAESNETGQIGPKPKPKVVPELLAPEGFKAVAQVQFGAAEAEKYTVLERVA